MDFGNLLGLMEGWKYDIEVSKYCQLASCCIVVFEHLITLDEEVELIWQSSWSLGKIVFILNRYYTLLSVFFNTYGFFSPNITDEVRLHFFKWQGWTGLVACGLAEIVLQMRLYALYFLNKRVLIVMVTFFVLSISASASIMLWVLNSVQTTAHPFPSATVCYASGIHPSFYAFWIPMLAFETLLCLLALIRGFQTFHKEGSLFQSGRHLVHILIRDSVLYFLVMFATYFTNFMIWAVARESLLEVPIAFSAALSCVLSNRIVLNVRRVNQDLKLIRENNEQRGARAYPVPAARVVRRQSPDRVNDPESHQGSHAFENPGSSGGNSNITLSGRRCIPRVRTAEGSLDLDEKIHHSDDSGFGGIVDYYYTDDSDGSYYIPSQETLNELDEINQLQSMRVEIGHDEDGTQLGFFSL